MNDICRTPTEEETTRQKIERYLKEHPDEHTRKFLDRSDVYLKKWDEDQKKREQELRENPPEEQSIMTEEKERGLLTHPINPLSERHPQFKSLTVYQVQKIEECFEEGLSIRSTKEALHVFLNLDVSFGTLQGIRKKMKEKEVSQSSSA